MKKLIQGFGFTQKECVYFSGLTLYLNKYIVALGVMNEPVLAATQMWCTLLGGWFQMRHDLGPFKVCSLTHFSYVCSFTSDGVSTEFLNMIV